MEEITIKKFTNNNSKQILILTYKGEGDPVRKLNDKVREYTDGRLYKEFVDINMDNPWMRVIYFE